MSYEASRRALAALVREKDGYTQPDALARAVCDAPAFQTLTPWEWWNVALCLAQNGRFPK